MIEGERDGKEVESWAAWAFVALLYHRVSRETSGGWRQWTGSKEELRANRAGRTECNGEKQSHSVNGSIAMGSSSGSSQSINRGQLQVWGQ